MPLYTCMAYTCIRIRRVVANVVSPCIYWGQRGKRALRVRVTVASRKPPCRDISLQCHAPSGLADSYWLVSLPWQPRVHVADAVLVSNHRLLPGAQTSSTKTRSLSLSGGSTVTVRLTPFRHETVTVVLYQAASLKSTSGQERGQLGKRRILRPSFCRSIHCKEVAA